MQRCKNMFIFAMAALVYFLAFKHLKQLLGNMKNQRSFIFQYQCFCSRTFGLLETARYMSTLYSQSHGMRSAGLGCHWHENWWRLSLLWAGAANMWRLETQVLRMCWKTFFAFLEARSKWTTSWWCRSLLQPHWENNWGRKLRPALLVESHRGAPQLGVW